MALGLVAGVLAVTTTGVLIDRFVLQAEWWQVEHSVTAVPAWPMAGVGPPPGPLTDAWQRVTPVHRDRSSPYDQVAHALVAGRLVTVSGVGLDVRDAHGGDARWHYRRDGWTLLGWAATGGVLAAYLERAGSADERMLVGFDAVTGRLLWRRPGERPAAPARPTLRWPAGSGVVLTADGERRTLYGLSAVTGTRRWTLPLPAGCRLPESAAQASGGDEELAALALDCPGRARMLALDPGRGRVRWSHPLKTAGRPEVTVRGDVTTVSDGGALRGYDGTGREFATRPGEDVCGDAPCPVAVADGRLVVVYRTGTHGRTRRIEAIDVRSGRSLWRRDLPGAPGYAALALAGGRLYGLRPRLAEDLLPAGVDVIDPATGEAATVPVPFAVDPGLDGARPWLAAAGGLLYAAVPQAEPRPGGGVRLVALRGAAGGPGPVELGGTAAADWPDACRLLPERGPAVARFGSHRPRPRRAEVGDVALPRPVSCTYRLDHGPSPTPTPSPTRTPEPGRTPGAESAPAGTLTVTVKWVSADAGSAAALLSALRATQPRARARDDIGGDEAYELGSTAGMIAVRVGRHVVAVNASGSPSAAAPVARVVAAGLRQPPQAP
ncbi:hypothetical protein DPM19_14615 [Actinomadura craniellae]|uniref:Pyrrolo-quinoline quinone repeat domain-containing protein n=1 Tax=Actinomadura craniellae TaxID=2231787 RepID=A0A365H7G7_9ACTN|nr:PQQ-binding-like beta-propeller repeat protein [Actinomadura craniellae]RAY14213.1 hypothetical protein DPM19_14615 [Actinomadura craniellae]